MKMTERKLINEIVTTGNKYSWEIYQLQCQMNDEKSKEIIKQMGDKYVCHPSRKVKRIVYPL